MILAALVIILFAYASQQDYETERVERQRYCEMVALWEADIHLPPEQRRGWPPYEGECSEDD
jgi:hypothetical protein